MTAGREFKRSWSSGVSRRYETEEVMKKILASLWLVFFLFFVLMLVLVVPALPDHLATHFDFNGNPNGYQEKSAYLSAMVVLGAVVNSLFFALYHVLGRIPEKWINLPRKDFWFATQERKAFVMERLKVSLLLPGVITNFVLGLVQQAIYQSNVPHPLVQLPMGFLPFVIGVVIILVVVVSIVLTRLPRPEEFDGTPPSSGL
jgi:uncharacterized membrane protein